MYKQLRSMTLGNLYLGKKATFPEKEHATGFSLASLREGCQSPEHIMKMSACKSTEELGCGSMPCIPHYFSYTLWLYSHFHSFSSLLIWKYSLILR